MGDAYELVETSIADLDVIFEFHKEDEATEEEVEAQNQITLKYIEDLEFKNMLSKEEDNMTAILSINSGAGGTESRLGFDAHAYVYNVGKRTG